MTTIKLKNGSGAPTAGDLVQGEPALDLTNKRLYTEDSGGTVIEVGTNPSTINIDAGTIDGAVIGGSSAAAITGTTITGTSFVSSGNMTFGDNDKAVFGAGSDLQIYHDGSNSLIQDAGTGDLIVKSNGTATVIKTNAGNNLLSARDAGSVGIFHDGSEKLTSTSTGIDVTGTVTADGLTVDGGNTLRLNAASTNDFFTIVQGGTQAVLTADSDAAANMLFKTATAGTDKSRMLIASGGDISFYEDTGTTAKFFWDASAESLGIGTTSPSKKLSIKTDGGGSQLGINIHNEGTATGDDAVISFETQGSREFTMGLDRSATSFVIAESSTLGSNQRLIIDDSGNLLVGCTSQPDASNFGGFINPVGQFRSSRNSTGSVTQFSFSNPNGEVGTIVTNGSATAYNTSSDYRLKENVVAMTGATARLKQLAPKRFNFIADADTTVDGFLAHEVQSVVPEAITGTHNEVDDDGNAVYQGIDQSKLVPLLVATIQELEARIAALESN